MRAPAAPRPRSAHVLALLLATVLAAVLVPPTSARAARLDPASPGLSIGTFNTNLQPWVPHEDEVVDTIRATTYDVLALQGVFSQKAADRITGDATIKQQYPYSYFVPGQQEPGRISSVSRTDLENWIYCLIGRGQDTSTQVQPLSYDPICGYLALNIAFLSQPGFQALVATMQTLPNGADALQAIDLAQDGRGVFYSTDGLPGQLFLSRYPLEDVRTTDFETYLIRRVNVYATVAGVRLAFVDWPNNAIEDIDPGLALLQTGATQPQTAQDLLDRTASEGVDVAVGTFNSGPDYQPEGYQRLLDNGYSPVTASDLPTYCPSTHAGLDTCRVPTYVESSAPSICSTNEGSTNPCPGQPTRAVDHILTSATGRCTSPDTFATTPVSQHIGLSAVCAKVGTSTAKADAYRLDQATTLSVASPGVLANDADRTRTVLLRRGPTQATDFALKADGSFTYTPKPGFSGTDRFTYLTDDGTATPTTVTLTVTRVANLAVSLAVPTGAKAGGSVAATVTVRNTGPGTASQVATGLNLPAGLTITRATGGVLTKDRRNVAFVASTLAPGASLSYPVTVAVDRGTTGTKTLTAVTASLVKDPALRDNAAQATVVVSR